MTFLPRRHPRLATLALLGLLWSGCSDGPPPVMGTLERDRIELVAEASEPIVEVLVREGETVETGQLLVRLYDSRLRANVEQAKAARERTRARLDELERGPRAEEISEGRARLAGAQGTLLVAQRQLERERLLARSGATSTERVDLARSRYEQALAERDASRASLDALERGTRSEELAQARATLAETESALAAVQIQLDRLEIRAPRKGQIDALPYKRGERPPAGAVLVVMLADGAPYARVYVPEAMRVHVRPGMEARVAVDGFKDTFAARVRRVSHEAAFTPFFALTERDRGRLAYLAEVDLTSPAARQLPTGVPVRVSFAGGRGAGEVALR